MCYFGLQHAPSSPSPSSCVQGEVELLPQHRTLCCVGFQCQPLAQKGLFSHPPAFPGGIKPSHTRCGYLCSAEERQQDVAEGPRGFPHHFCPSGPTSGLRWRGLCPANCCWLWSPGHWLPAGRVSHWHRCSCGWYLAGQTQKGELWDTGMLYSPGKHQKELYRQIRNELIPWNLRRHWISWISGCWNNQMGF